MNSRLYHFYNFIFHSLLILEEPIILFLADEITSSHKYQLRDNTSNRPLPRDGNNIIHNQIQRGRHISNTCKIFKWSQTCKEKIHRKKRWSWESGCWSSKLNKLLIRVLSRNLRFFNSMKVCYYTSKYLILFSSLHLNCYYVYWKSLSNFSSSYYRNSNMKFNEAHSWSKNTYATCKKAAKFVDGRLMHSYWKNETWSRYVQGKYLP